MRKLISFVLVVFLAVTLSACAGLKGGKQTVTCPACGFEFTPEK